MGYEPTKEDREKHLAYYYKNKGGSFHYTNTQPLSVEENRKKKDNLE